MQHPALPAAWGPPLLQGTRRMEGDPQLLLSRLCETFSPVLSCHPIITALGAVCRLAGGGDPLQAPQALARQLLGGSCPAGRMLDPIHPMGIPAVGPLPAAVPGLGAVPLSPMLLGKGAGGRGAGKGEGSEAKSGHGGPQTAPRCGGGEGTHLAAAACGGQAVNHATGISRLITSPLLPRLRTPWGNAKKKSELKKKKLRRKIPGWKEASAPGPVGSSPVSSFRNAPTGSGELGQLGRMLCPSPPPGRDGCLRPSRRDWVDGVLAPGAICGLGAEGKRRVVGVMGGSVGAPAALRHLRSSTCQSSRDSRACGRHSGSRQQRPGAGNLAETGSLLGAQGTWVHPVGHENSSVPAGWVCSGRACSSGSFSFLRSCFSTSSNIHLQQYPPPTSGPFFQNPQALCPKH